MAKLGDLVVRVGLDPTDLNKKLGTVQRRLRGMTGNIERLGQDMTRSLSLPLAAVGAAAVKSAADLETLETSFVSLTGGAEQAAMMMKQLNEFTARTPFQIEAVANSARQLIASGTDISQVNEQLQFLGDIAATSGKSIDEITAVFAKVQAKGKVELESLNQLAERGIPIFTALSEATGLPAEKLGAGRVTVEQFNAVLKSFAEEGGFASGAMERLSQTAAGKFSTALDNAKQALAVVGEKLLPLVSQGLDALTSAFRGFGNLSDTTVKLGLAIGTVVASLGPLLVLLPQIAAGIKLVNFAFLSTAPGVLALSVALGAIAGLFLRVRKEAKQATDQVRQQEAALVSLNKTQLAMEAGIKLTGDTTQDVARAEKFRADSLSKVADAQAELTRLEEAAAQGDALVKAGLRDKIAALRDYINTYDRSAEAATRLIEVLQHETDVLNSSTAAVQNNVDTLGKLFSMLEEIQVSAAAATMTMGQFFSFLENFTVPAIANGIETVTESANTMANAIGSAFSSASAQAASFKDFLVNVTKDIVAQFVRQAAAAALAKGNIVGALGLAVGGGLFQRVGVPALQNGGLAYGPTMAMVGDNRNAAIDPEVVAPLSKLKDMMGGGVVEVVGRIKGDDIYLSNARNSSARNRYA
jgi:tape measure domain-containing protein